MRYPIILYILFLAACISEPSSINPQVVDQDSVFPQADNLRYKQHFTAAARQYTIALQAIECTPQDSLYAFNQITYCYLMQYDTAAAAAALQTSDRLFNTLPSLDLSTQGDYYYNKARWAIIAENQSEALLFAHRSRQAFQTDKRSYHLKMAQVLTLMGLAHFEDGSITDSAAYYGLLAGDVFHHFPELAPYSWEYDYLQAGLGWLNRTHRGSERYCRLALAKLEQLPDDHLIAKAKCWNLLGNMLKKQADGIDRRLPENVSRADSLYHLADTLCFAQAISLAKQANSYLVQKFYNSRIINAQRFPDSTLFFKYLNELTDLLEVQPNRFGYTDRLLGYFYYFRGELDKAIAYYQQFLRVHGNDPLTDYDLIDEAYFFLREANRQLHRFDGAIEAAILGLALFKCCPDTVDLLDPITFEILDSLHNPCINKYGFLAGILVDKYLSAGKREDLLLANRYYEMVERNYYSSLGRVEEEALLGTQLEKGSYFFSRALEATYLMWELSDNAVWVDAAWKYVEKMKAYLLFRDMLKPQDQTGNAKSLTDSIRLYQSRLDHLNAILPTEQADLETWKNYDERLRGLLARRHRRRQSSWQQQIRGEGTDIQSVRASLTPRQGVIQFMLANDHAFGIYLDRDTIAFFQLGGQDRLDTLLADYRESLSSHRPTPIVLAQYQRTAHHLFQHLIGPFASRLTAIDKLLIIPDAELQRISFGPLLTYDASTLNQDFRNFPYLMRRVQISYSPSWQIYQSKRKEGSNQAFSPQLAFWTSPEVRAIREMAQLEKAVTQNLSMPIQFFTGSAQMKQGFLNKAGSYSHIHLSLHARSNPSNRWQQQLFFGDFDDHSQILHSYELGDLQLQARLVVLAACETADGQQTAGEGTYSLARSLLQTGAHQVLATLGKVPAGATGLLLQRFYWFLGKGNAPELALHLAQLEHLEKSNDPVLLFPGFWGRLVVFI